MMASIAVNHAETTQDIFTLNAKIHFTKKSKQNVQRAVNLFLLFVHRSMFIMLYNVCICIYAWGDKENISNIHKGIIRKNGQRGWLK